VINGGLEWRRWMQPSRTPVRVGPAIFMDAARAFRGLDSSIERWQYDVGTGFRLAIPGSGVLRVDVAHGLRDGRNALSMGWTK
jgi:outer membrane translocation and assembly module TamA